MPTLIKLADDFARAFETRKRDNGDEFRALRDGSPQWMTDVVREAHEGGEMLPDDFRYRFIAAVASEISEALDEGADLDEARHERVDGLVPVYNAERSAWLASHLSRAAYVDDAIEQGLYGPGQGEFSVFEALGVGIYQEISEIWDSVLGSLRGLADDDDDAPTCDGCGRAEDDCSANPCADVIADREA